jgi:hypothetical protein
MLIPVALVFMVSQAWGTTYYVASSGSNTAPYDTWAKAANQFYTALASATVSGDEVWIKNGRYQPTNSTTPFAIAAGVRVYGSFVGTETAISQRSSIAVTPALMDADNIAAGGYLSVGTNHTILDGLFAGTPMTHIIENPGANVVLDGFELRNGTNSIFSISEGCTFRNMYFNSNALDGEIQDNTEISNWLSKHHRANTPEVLNPSIFKGSIRDYVIDGDQLTTLGAGIYMDGIYACASLNNITIKNLKIGGSAGVLVFAQEHAVVMASDLTVDSIIVDGAGELEPTSIFSVLGTVNVTINRASVKNTTNTNSNPGAIKSLVYVDTTTNTEPTNDGITQYRVIINDSTFTNTGLNGSNAFYVPAIGSTEAPNQGAAITRNTIFDGTAVNNASSVSNAPTGYYRFHSSGRRSIFGW